MHSPGFDAHHRAVDMHRVAHHRAVDMHHAAHQRAAFDHARRSAGHGRASVGIQPSGLPAARTVPRRSQPRHRRTSGVVKLLRFVFQLAVVAVLVGVVLLVIRPTHPEWLAQLVHDLEGLVRTLRNAVP